MISVRHQPIQKVITFVVPCYNSANYMDNCIQSLIDLNSENDDVEIIIVDDGSQKDNTLEKAKCWEKKFPTAIRVIHQENGGHGEAINTGLKNAEGLYFEVVDSDDYIDRQGAAPIMAYLRKQAKKVNDCKKATDLVISNYVYNKVSKNRLTPITYKNALPQNREFTWGDIKSFVLGEYLSIHSMIYRTRLLQDIRFEMPKHTFYVDSILACSPLRYVETMYYINTNMYMYYIGRPDQSVNEEIIFSQTDHLLRVMKIVIEDADIEKLKAKPKLEKYTYHYFAQMMSVCTVTLRKINTKESKAQLKDMWNYMKKHDKGLYRNVFKSPLCWCLNVPGKFGRAFCLTSYKLTKIVIPFT